MNGTVQYIGFVCVLTFAAAAPAAAQDSFASVQDRLRPGDTVVIVDDGGVETRAKVLSVGVSELRVSSDGHERVWREENTWRIARHGDSVRNGMMWGAVAGAGAGVVGGLALASLLMNEGHDSAGPFLFVVGAGALSGAGIGAGFDALIRGRTLIYQKRSQRVVLTPSLTPRVQGLRVAVNF